MARAEEAIILAIARSLTFRAAGNRRTVNRELEQLRRTAPRRRAPCPGRGAIAPAPQRARPGSDAAEPSRLRRLPRRHHAACVCRSPRAVSQGSEAEIAVSNNGQNIIITQGFSYLRSTDGGQTFTPCVVPVGSPPNICYVGTNGGDGSIAFGRSGAFYASTIAGIGLNVYATTDNGLTLPLLGAAPIRARRAGGGTPCGFNSGPPANTAFPDQEHIAADRFNPSASSQDMVYFVWRQGGSGGSPSGPIRHRVLQHWRQSWTPRAPSCSVPAIFRA